MSRALRIGTQLWPDDPFWVQVREAIRVRAESLGLQLHPIDVVRPELLSDDEQVSFVEEVLAQNLDALLGWSLSDALLRRLADAGLPIVMVVETNLRYPRVVSPTGLYDIAVQVGEFLAERLDRRGTVVAVGGVPEEPSSRLSGIRDALARYPAMRLHYIPVSWRYERAYPRLVQELRACAAPIDAVFGFSDSLALAARDAGRALGIFGAHPVIVGINGDALALAAIADGSMTATIETPAAELGIQALDIAARVAEGLDIPAHLSFQPRLVTSRNVGEVAARQLIALAGMPSSLVGVNRELEQRRLAQLELSLEINRRVGALLDRRRLAREIGELIRANYGYDAVQMLGWDARARVLVCEGAADDRPDERVPADEVGILGAALLREEPIFIPDVQLSSRFSRDPGWPETRSRVVLPIRLGDAILGLLDLHSHKPARHTRQEIVGLQLLADQLAIALSNADLYSEAVRARAAAEQADQLKTRLLANVSHELRTPLNVILGYSSSALALPNPYGETLPPALLQDLQRIYQSGEHLIRLINDLLDLSRAEINALELFPETIDTRAFLNDVFQSVLKSMPLPAGVERLLDLPGQLPLIQADPVRLRQALLNLLSNAHKFTESGRIVLGAEVAPPHLHLWVADTGAGIPPEVQERIFEPFGSGAQSRRRREGVGLGLSITRRLIALHRGSLSLESQPGRGSTFHIYLPLPSLDGAPALVPAEARAALVLIGAAVPAPLAELAERRGWELCTLRADDDLNALLDQVHPAALAWDMAHAGPADWALIQRVRALPRLARLPFVLFGQPDSATKEVSVGLTNILTKPLSGKTLVETIDALRPPPAAGPVLIVDDDPEARGYYRGIVERGLPGYRVETADSGAAALAAIERETPGLVVLDLVLPDMEGFAVLDQLRANPSTRRVPVVVISGFAVSLEEVRRLDHANVIFQSKDMLSREEIVALLNSALAGDTLPAQTSALVKRAIACLQENHARAISRQEIADAVGVSKDYLSHIFNEELGISPWEYLSRYRIKQAKALLRATNASVTEIAVRVGFDDLSYFSRVFNKHVGCSPRAFRESAAR